MGLACFENRLHVSLDYVYSHKLLSCKHTGGVDETHRGMQNFALSGKHQSILGGAVFCYFLSLPRCIQDIASDAMSAMNRGQEVSARAVSSGRSWPLVIAKHSIRSSIPSEGKIVANIDGDTQSRANMAPLYARKSGYV